MAGRTYGITIADGSGSKKCELFSPSNGQSEYRFHKLPPQGVNKGTEGLLGEMIGKAFYTEGIHSSRDSSYYYSCSRGFDGVVTYDSANKTFYALYSPNLASVSEKCVFTPPKYSDEHDRPDIVFSASQNDEVGETEKIEIPGTVMMAYSGGMCQTAESLDIERRYVSSGVILGMIAGALAGLGIAKSAGGFGGGALGGAIAGAMIAHFLHNDVLESPSDSRIKAFFDEEVKAK